MEPTNETGSDQSRRGASDGSVTLLKCDHASWGMHTVLMTPAVAIACAVAVALKPAQFLAGVMIGVWASMWMVVLWAWLTRRQSPNDKRSGLPESEGGNDA